MVMLILVFRVISVIQLFTYLNTSAQPLDQRGSDNRGCTVTLLKCFLIELLCCCVFQESEVSATRIGTVIPYTGAEM